MLPAHAAIALMRIGAALALGFQWWRAELAGMVPEPIKDWWEGDRNKPLVSVTKDGVELRLVGRSADRKVAQFPAGEGAPFSAETCSAIVSALNGLPVTRAGGIDLEFPKTGFLSLPVDLPTAATARLSAALSFEVERRTPFNLAEVYYAGEVLEPSARPGFSRVHMTLARRSDVDPWKDSLAKHGWALRQLVCAGRPVISLTASDRRGLNRWQVAQVAFAVLAIGLFAKATWWELSSLAQVVEHMEAEVAAARPAVRRVAALEQELAAATQRAKRLQDQVERVPVFEVVDHLAAIIPDDAWLNRIHIAYPAVTISGQSGAAAQLLATLHGSQFFSEAAFQSPIAVQQDRTERFDIRLQLSGAGTP